MTPERADRRIVRRALHRSRSVPAVIVLLALAVVAGWFAVECALALLDRPALLARPGAVVDLLTAPEPGTVTTVVAVTAAVAGLVAVVLALSPGRHARHAIAAERVMVVADDGVIAGALARTARTTAALGPDRAQAWVSRRRAQVRVTPTAGVAVPVAEIERAVGAQVQAWSVTPPVQVAVSTTSTERLG